MLSALRLSSSVCRACMVCCMERFSCREKQRIGWKIRPSTHGGDTGIWNVWVRWWLTTSSSWLRERNRSLWLEMMESRESIWPWGRSRWGFTPKPEERWQTKESKAIIHHLYYHACIIIFNAVQTKPLNHNLWSNLMLLSFSCNILFYASLQNTSKTGLRLDCHV